MGMRQFTEPDINLFFDDLNQAALLNNKASFIGKGYMKITVGDIRGNTIPNILQGSQLEANGVLWVADATLTIPTTGLADGTNYLYILENGDLGFSTAPPEWRSVKGGWYLNNYRALLKFDRKTIDSNYTYSNKVVLDSFAAMYETPQYSAEPYDFTQTDPQGTLVYSQTTAGDYTVTLEPGMYQIHLIAAGGGGGGGDVTSPNHPSGAGGRGGSIKRFVNDNSAFGGGSGVSGVDSTGDGGAGGSGAYLSTFLQVAYKTKYKFIIGAGGANGVSTGSSGNNGGAGGDTLFAFISPLKWLMNNATPDGTFNSIAPGMSPYDDTDSGPGAGGYGEDYNKRSATAGVDGAVFIYKL
jgi:hypothetical protein